MGGLRVSMQCNEEFLDQLSVCSRTEENHGKPWWNWPVAGPSGYKLTSSQESDIKYANPNICPYLAVDLFEKLYVFVITEFSFYLHMSDEHQAIVSNICEENTCLYAHTCIQTYLYLYLWLFDYWWIWISIVVMVVVVVVVGDRMLYEVRCPSSNRGVFVTVHISSALLMFHHVVQRR
jgi:hypothetical protein